MTNQPNKCPHGMPLWCGCALCHDGYIAFETQCKSIEQVLLECIRQVEQHGMSGKELVERMNKRRNKK